MHICFLTNEYPKIGFPHGGLGSFVKTIAEALVNKGIQVTVIGLNYTNTTENVIENGVQLIRIQKSKVKGLSWYLNSKNIAKTILEEHKKNPIHIVEGPELSFAFLPKIKGIKYVIRLHGGHHFFAEGENRGINRWKGFQEKRSFAKADGFIAVSNYVKSHTAKYLSYHNKPIEVIFNPIDTQLFQPKEIPIHENSITFAGTICEKKGVRQLIQAFPLVKQKFPDAVLNLYGRDWLYPNGNSYIKMLQEVELPKLGVYAKDIIFHGVVSSTALPEIYSKAAVCVFPSHMETLGLVAPEAMACKKPVVFTNLGPGNEIINNGENGLTLNPNNIEEIAAAIIQVFENKDRVKIMGENARMFVLQKFNPEMILHKNIDFYNQIIK